VIDQATLEAHKGSSLDADELRFQKHLRMVMHRPAGVPQSRPALLCFAAVNTEVEKLQVVFPQTEVDRLLGTTDSPEATLEDILMEIKALSDDTVAFPLVACEGLGDQKTRVRIVSASDVARWMPSLGAVAGITDEDLLTYEEYEVLT